MRKSRYSFRTLQFTFALYMMWVSFRGPLWARTLRMSIYISSFDLRMGMPRLWLFSPLLYILFTDSKYGFFGFIFAKELFLFVFFGMLRVGFGGLLLGRLLGCIGVLG